jgi:hypothetical protein
MPQKGRGLRPAEIGLSHAAAGFRPGRNKMSHAEIIRLKNKKSRKKKKQKKSKSFHLKEYMKLTDNEEVSKKSAARSIMDIVEEINDEGMNNKRYLDIMDKLMILHNEGDNSSPYREDDYLDRQHRWFIFTGRNVISSYLDGNPIGRTDSIGQFGTGERAAVWGRTRVVDITPLTN